MGRLADAALKANASSSFGPRCTVATVLTRLDPELRGDLEQLLAMPISEMRHTTIVAALKDIAGIDIRMGAVGHHRRGECRCGRTD